MGFEQILKKYGCVIDKELNNFFDRKIKETKDYFLKKNFRDKKYNGSIFDVYSKRFSVSMGIIQGNLLYSLSFSSILDSRLDDKMKSLSLSILNEGYCKTNE